MQILTTQEQYHFNKPPLFDHIQRKQFFDFSKKLSDPSSEGALEGILTGRSLSGTSPNSARCQR